MWYVKALAGTGTYLYLPITGTDGSQILRPSWDIPSYSEVKTWEVVYPKGVSVRKSNAYDDKQTNDKSTNNIDGRSRHAEEAQGIGPQERYGTPDTLAPLASNTPAQCAANPPQLAPAPIQTPTSSCLTLAPTVPNTAMFDLHAARLP